MVCFKALYDFHVSLYSKFNSKLTTAPGHSDRHQTNGPRVEMSSLFETNSGSFCSLRMYLSNDIYQSNEI